MRRNLYSTWLLTAALFVASLFCATTASASHAVGADLTYVCLGNNTYRFTMTFYRDCSGIAAPSSFTASVNNGCGIAAATFTLAQIGTCTDITPICATSASTCNGGTVPGVQQCTYSGIYTFPASTCANWTVSASECCRNPISTIPNASSFNLYVEATFPVNPSVCNSSPDFTQPPVPYVCAGQSFTYNHGVIDLEGDSLSYQLVNPLTSAGTIINYGAPYTPSIPLSVVTPPGVVFNQFNGQMTFTPTTVGQVSVVAVLVREYRNGVLISTVRRDVQIIVLNCGANVTPQLSTVSNVTGAAFTPVNNSGTFRICPGQTMSFSITATDANPAQVLTILSNAAANFPGAIVNVTTGAGNTKIFNFTWTPTANSVGVRTLAIEVRDNNCPTYGFSVEGYTIVVQGVNARANVGAFCYGTPTTINLTAQAQEVPGGQYQWSASPPVPGLPVLPSNQNITVTITQQTTFTVRYQDNNCNAIDTVIVQSYGPVSASPATVSGYCPTDPALQLTATYTNPAPPAPAACTLGNVAQCTGLQSNRTIGTGAANTGTTATGGAVGSPYQGFWHDGRFQMLLTAPELTAAGVQPGLITRLQLNVTSKFSTAPYLNFNINMGCVAATSLSATTGFIGGLSNVYSNVAGYTTAVGWNQYVFTTPYRWDGISSLVVEICFDNTAFTSYDQVAVTPTTAQTVLYRRQDGASGCTLTGPTSSNARPDIVLRNCPIVVPPAGVTYAWSVVAPANGAVSNANIANPSATVTPGLPNGSIVRYIVTASDGRCTSKDTVIVNTNCNGCSVAAGIAPVVATNGLELSCTNLTRQLDAATPSLGDGVLSYSWAGPGIVGSTTAGIITVNAAGSYTVTVTNTKTLPAPTTCTATATVVVTLNNTPPAATLTSDIATITCTDPSATLTATPNVPATQYTYVWSAANGGSAAGYTGFTNNTTLAGTFTVVVTNVDNGCTASASVAVAKSVALPVVVLTQTGPTVNCNTPTVTLDASSSTPAGVDFLWSGSSVPPTPADIAPTYIVDVSNTGTHTVVVRNSFNGCTASASAAVTLDTAIAAMTLVAPVTFINCTTPSATLTATPLTAGQTYTWSANTLPVPASNVATVTVAGTYTVTITNPTSGCSRSRSVVITKNTTVPVVTLSASATQLTCVLNTITLTATPSTLSTYAWSAQPAPVVGTNTATVGVAGTHTVTVTTTANGCTASSTVAITQIAGLTNATITSTATVLNCTTLSSTLTAASTTPGATFTWSANAGGVTTPSITVNTVGTYTVTVLNPANGCTAIASETITSNTTAPVVTLTAPVTHITCTVPSATLTATLIAAHTYAWSANTLPVPASNVATVTAAGTYTVTITNSANGCTSSSTIVITKDAVAPVPTLTASAPQLNCTVQTITLTATPATLSTYAWSAGTTPDVTNNTATVTSPSNYTVTVTTTANGCTGTASLAMTQNIVAPTVPTIAATAPNLSCSVTSITLTASGSTPVATVTYAWPTVIAASTTVTLPGLYAVTATNSVNNCTALATRLISIDTITPAMTLTANRTTLTCTNTNATLTATLIANHIYTWSPNVASSTNNTATVNVGGIYTVTITNPANGCTRSRTITIIQDIVTPLAIIAPSTPTALTLTCTNTPIVLDASVSSPAAGLTFAWSPASTGATKSVTTPGTYTVTATITANGCTNSAQVVVTQDIAPAAPVITASLPELTCSVLTLSLTATAGGTAYTWSGGTAGATTNVRDITAAGTYTVTMTSATNGCTGTASYTVTRNSTQPVVTITAPQVLTCVILNTTVTAGGGVAYAWSGGTTPTTAANTFSGASATYTVTVTSGTNGCTNTSTVAIVQTLTAPTTAISGSVAPQLTCTTTSTTLTASGADGYIWNNTLTTPSISVTNPGIYTVTGTLAATGCTTSATFTVIQDIVVPIPTITADFQTITCAHPTATLTVGGTGVNTLLWDNGTTVSPRAVVAAGTYTVTTTTTANGCTATASIVIAIDQVAPIIAIDPPSVLTCTQTTINLNATSNVATTTYAWDNATTLNPRPITAIGTYTVIGTNTANGCTASATKTVIQNVTIPTISLVGSSSTATPDTVLTCTNTSINLTPSGATNYAWDATQVASQTATGVANVVNAGTYTVTATNIANGCTNTRAQIILQNITAPPMALTTPFTNITCSRPSVTSVASGADDYVWSNGGITNVITVSAPMPNATGSTTYTVIGTSTSNGCTTSRQVVITYDNVLPTPTMDADTNRLTCSITSATIFALGLGNDTFVWSGTGAFTSAGNSATTNSPGIYTVTVTSAVNGCTATGSYPIIQDIVPPVVTIDPAPVLTCATTIVTLSAQGADTYLWTGPSIVSQILNTADVQATGVYTVVGTGVTNGCTASAIVTVMDNLIPPVPTIQASGILNCQNTSVVLTATGGDTYIWSANAQTAVTPSVTVTSGGTYTVTARNSGNGCTANATFVVVQDTVRPVLTLVSDFATISCTNPIATLTVTPNTLGFNFAWTGGISTNNTASVTTGATYVVTVTNTANSCQRTATIAVAQDNNPPAPVITASLPQLNCAVQSLDLSVGDAGTRTYSAIVWDDASTSNPRNVSTPQIYSVTVTDAINGCTATASFNVTQSTTPPIITITTVNPSISCRDSLLSLSATALPASIPASSFTWSNGDGGFSTITPIRITNSPVYSVEVTDPQNGCSASQSITIARDTVSPPVTINPPAVLTCATTTISLSAQGGDTYNWSAPATTNPVGLGATSTAGIYTVTASFNGNGCTASRSVTVIQDVVPPMPSITSDITELTCTALTANLTAFGGDTYVWTGVATSNGNIATATVSTTYTVVAMLNSNGCTAAATIFVPLNIAAPSVQAITSQPALTCVILTADLTANGTGDTYVWSPSNSSASPYTIGSAGTYTVTATRATNGCTATSSVTIGSNTTPPIPSISTPTVITCNTPTTTLTAFGGDTYIWSPVLLQSGATAVIDHTSTYTVTVTQNSNGCTASATVFVADDTELPTVSIAQPNILTCSLQSVPLVAATGLNAYNWVDLTNTTIGTASSIAVANPGTYTVYGTGTNGCSASATITVLADRVIPTGTLAAATNILNCTTTTTTLVASGGDTYAWTTNASNVNGPNADANGPGTYTVTVTTTSNGCNSVSTVVITQDIVAQTPMITANHPMLTCIDRTIDLTVSGAGPFTWSNNVAVTGQQIVTVNQPGVYTVMATTPSNNCTAVTTYTVTQDITEPAPSIMASAPILNCNVPSLVLTASVPAGAAAVTYRWNDALSTAVNTLLVSTPALYEVTATQASNGCTAIAQQLVLQDIGQPIVTITNTNVLTCTTPSTTLTASTVNGADTFVWSGTLGNSPSATVSTAGTYTVTATSIANGCTNIQTVVVTEDKIAPVPNLIASTSTITCVVPSVTISVSSGNNDTYLWSPNGETTSTITVSTGGTYTVEATSPTNGCTANTSILILENTTPPSVQVTSNNPSITCANRRAILTATGADVYSWSAVVSSNGAIANVDASGTYTVTGTETSNGCTAVASIAIGSDLVNPTAAILPAATLTCATQSVVLAATGGGNYTWSSNTNSTNGANATVTVQGNYTVTVTTPSNGCTATAVTTVGRNIVPPAPVISVDGQLTCANPIRTLTATSGNSFPNNYAWSTNVNSISDSTATTLSLGIYTVTITRASNGCTASSVIAVTQDISVPAVSMTTNIATLTCTNPTAVLTANGGNSFAWSINVDAPLNNVATASASGIYTVTSTQATNGCTASATVTINQDIALPSASANVTNVGCNGALSGAIDLTIANSINTLYTWNNGAHTEDLSSLPIGTYTCIITGGNGCTTSISVIVEQNSPISATFDVFNVRCNGGNDGRILTIPTGGTAPYSYAVSNGAFVGNVLNLVANVYTVTITDARGCVGTASTIVTEPTVLAPIATQQSAPLCNGQANGQALVNIVGGTQPYYAHWDSQEDSTTAIRLNVGVHTVTVTDGNQCSKTATLTISEPAVIAVSITNTIATKCYGSHDGIMTATITGGTAVGAGAGFSTIWTGDNVYYPGVTPTNAALGAGTYYVTASDINGCTATASGTILQPSIIYTGVTAQTPATCVLSADARATGVASGGTPAQPGTVYSYRWDSGETSNPAVQLIRGTHTVTASDANGCTATAQFFVEGPDAISLNAQSINNVTCFGLSNGNITVQVVGGTPSYLYAWSNGQTTPGVTGLPAGIHTVSVTDANGCTLAPVSFNISQPNALVITTMTPQNPACNAGNTGRISVTATGGTVPYSYNWSNNGFGQPLINLGAGNYTVIVSDAKQCTTSMMATIGEPDAVIAVTTKIDAVCYGEKTGRIQVDNPFGGTPPYLYSLDGISFGPTNYFIDVPAGTYTAHIQDALGCELAMPVEITSNPQMLLNAGEDVNINLGQSVQLQGSTASTAFTTVWTPAATLSDATILNPSATPTETTRYHVEITDASGCKISDNVLVTVLTDRHIYVPTIFTPNGDGTNDYFGVFGGVDVTRIKLFQVFDRWGEQVFEGKNFQPNDSRYAWDGRLQGALLNANVFVYYIQVEFKDGKTEEFKGDVTLMK